MNLSTTGSSFLNLLDWVNFKTRQAIDLLLLPLDSFLDSANLWAYSRLSLLNPKASKLTYDLVFFAHTIEKGLSLPAPREQFGKSNIARVIRILKHSIKDEDIVFPDFALAMSMGSLHSYLEFHRNRGVASDFLKELEKEFDSLRTVFVKYGKGGFKDVADVSDDIMKSKLSYPQFLLSRYSCRTFRPDPIPTELISEIVMVAQRAPSQCNRQSVRLHIFQNSSDVQRLLTLQQGANGFAGQVPTLVVVTSDLCAWMSRAERNQAYVDAGIYAMSFLLACHAHCLGACPLNFSKTFLSEWAFKKAARIPKNERVAILIAMGFPCGAGTKAACSARQSFHGIVKLHE